MTEGLAQTDKSGLYTGATAAAALGGHVRIGFENNLLLKTGEGARDDPQLVQHMVELASALGRPVTEAQQPASDSPFDGASEAERFSGVSERHLTTCPIKTQSTTMPSHGARLQRPAGAFWGGERA